MWLQPDAQPFVEMTDSSQADQTIAAFNGTNFEGRSLNVNEAKPKPSGGGRLVRHRIHDVVDAQTNAKR